MNNVCKYQYVPVGVISRYSHKGCEISLVLPKTEPSSASPAQYTSSNKIYGRRILLTDLWITPPLWYAGNILKSRGNQAYGSCKPMRSDHCMRLQMSVNGIRPLKISTRLWQNQFQQFFYFLSYFYKVGSIVHISWSKSTHLIHNSPITPPPF